MLQVRYHHRFQNYIALTFQQSKHRHGRKNQGQSSQG